MESPFTYNCTASGNSFLARKKEVSQTVLNIRSRVHTVIYEPPKTGKQSLIDMAVSQSGLTPACIDMIGMIDADELLHALQDTPEHTLVYIKNFQNILRLPDWERAAADLSHRMQSDDAPAYILSGSGINAMKYIFEEKKLFYRQFDRVRLSPIDERSVTDHIIRTFLKVGRVVEQSQAERIYNTADGHPWYIWQIADTCFSLTKGYLSDEPVPVVLPQGGLRRHIQGQLLGSDRALPSQLLRQCTPHQGGPDQKGGHLYGRAGHPEDYRSHIQAVAGKILFQGQ